MLQMELCTAQVAQGVSEYKIDKKSFVLLFIVRQKVSHFALQRDKKKVTSMQFKLEMLGFHVQSEIALCL